MPDPEHLHSSSSQPMVAYSIKCPYHAITILTNNVALHLKGRVGTKAMHQGKMHSPI